MPEGKRDRNPFWLLVTLAGVAFVMTALGYVMSLLLLQPATGRPVQQVDSPLVKLLNERGESMLLGEAAVLAVASLVAMGFDRVRSAARVKSDSSKSSD